MRRPPVRVAVLGAGTVGREVIRGLLDFPERLAAEDGPSVVLGGVAVRDVARAKATGVPEELLTDAPAHLVADPSIDVVVELLGGDEPAHTLVTAALSAGKSVVTANKHVVAHHGPELEALARRSAAMLRFEAAVGGGIPVLAPLAGDLAANEVARVRGIVNGTTNHILTAMAADGRTYEAVLREAQELGYAEADPSGDVEGHDAVNKLVILARLAFGAWIQPGHVATRPPSLRGASGPGITGVTRDALAGAGALGLAIRLLASAERPSPRAPVTASVLPTAVPAESPLGRTTGVRNRIEIQATPVGDIGLDGPGAGGPATSSAVLGDVAAVAREAGSTWAGRTAATALAGEAVRDGLDRERPWYLFLPGVRAGRAVRAMAESHAELPGGLAVRTSPLAAPDLVRRIREVAPDTLDAACYPVTE